MSLAPLPESPLCRAALALATGAYEPVLLNHSLRSFVFGDAFGQQRGREYDRELLYVSCLLHDLGLTDGTPVETRFEVEGADAAQAFLASHGVGRAEQELVWDAIALHTTMVIPQRKRAEIALCQMGAAIDVGFAPTSLLPPEITAAALRAFPRLGFKRAIVGAFCGLVRRNAPAAAQSPVVASVAERLVPGFSHPHFCDVVAGAGFED
jgi:hypothetical protein